jgi:NADPH-dependent curcumin reductase CurA
MKNRQLVLRERPTGEVTAEHFEWQEDAVPDPKDGEVLVRSMWLSFDPAQRGWLNDIRSYVPPVAIGEVMRARGIGEVVASRVDRVPTGTLVAAELGWQEYAVIDPRTSEQFEVVPPGLPAPELMLSVLGLTGLTAYFGMLDIGRPVAGDTVLVTSAAGATGSIAGQIARIKGAARVVGTAGTDEKRAWVRDVADFDECVDHYDDKVRRRLREVAPDGYNVVFDNVGGALLDAALFNIAERARVVLCGSISTGYRPERPEVGLHYYQLLTTRRSRMEGFIVTDYAPRFPEARAELRSWLEDGRLRQEHDVLDGLERAPEGLRRLFEGANLGKQLLRVSGANQ